MAWRFGLAWDLPAYLYLGAVGVALAAIDLDTKRLPNVIVLPSYPVAAVLFLLPALLEGQWDNYVRAIAGAAALFGVFFLLALIHPAGMGFGDVKLAGVLGEPARKEAAEGGGEDEEEEGGIGGGAAGGGGGAGGSFEAQLARARAKMLAEDAELGE